ncbi:IS1096 element passenger TnpR family protein [Rhodopirellula sallentina]|uniref:Plasmid pRiA4b ORF-3-like protein n=1 Tax=Rhodopirellula sallentina SM41 TaxID=1263870 RepID=M5U5S6_9BACT|nr:hypothetical protein [Rhodopirellula sallentina]EMI56629.1 Plasmid pRiA4b ORF-3-like protein [Rhodopirellula sallentina SM41]
MTNQPTKTQAKYLSFIHAYTEAAGEPPSMQDVADALDVSTASVSGMFKTLEKKALIERTNGEARSIEVLVDPASLPKWRKAIRVSMQFWMPKNASQDDFDQRAEEVIDLRKAQRRRAKNAVKFKNRMTPDIYRFKITLMDFKPAIWRRIETADTNLETFHEHIQTAMGWTNSHLHRFVIKKKSYCSSRMLSDFDDGVSEPYDDLLISDLVSQHGNKLKLRYEYDFGDNWQHEIKLEKILRDCNEPAEAFPRCIAGEHACPPEDCGGVWGYADLLAALADPKHERHEELMEWIGPVDPLDFDVAETTSAMRAGLPSW